jgi:hypothetical protein
MRNTIGGIFQKWKIWQCEIGYLVGFENKIRHMHSQAAQTTIIYILKTLRVNFIRSQEIIFMFLWTELFNFNYSSIRIPFHMRPTLVWKFFATESTNLRFQPLIIILPRYIIVPFLMRQNILWFGTFM